METPAPKPHQKTLHTGFTIIGGVIGTALGRYSGISLLIPVVITLVAAWVLSRVVAERTRPIVPAIAVQLGQFGWLIVGALILQTIEGVWIDAVILTIGLLWLIAQSGIFPVMLLALYQVLGLAMNVLAWLAVPLGSAEHRALLVHIILRVLALVLMLIGLRQIKAASKAAPASPADSLL